MPEKGDNQEYRANGAGGNFAARPAFIEFCSLLRFRAFLLLSCICGVLLPPCIYVCFRPAFTPFFRERFALSSSGIRK